MIYENNLFIVYYSDCDKKYIGKLLNILNKRIPNILAFFKLDYQGKITIKLYNNLDEYKDNIMNSFQQSYDNGECDVLRTFKY